MHLRTLLIFSVLSLAFGQDRKITPKLNPDCESCSENTTLVYIRADGPHDTIHQLWDFTRGTPTIIYAVAGLNSSLTVAWTRNKPINFTMSEEPKYSFAVAIPALIEYNDVKDLGQISRRADRRSFPLRDVTWSLRDSILTEQEAMLVMRAERFRGDDGWRNGSIDVKLDLLPSRDYAPSLPHLVHTANSSLLDVTLSNLTATQSYNASRFALRLLLVATEDWRASMRRAMEKSLDDEHTPGVFEIIEMKTPSCESGAGGYMQFRPVAYTQRERSVTSSTVVHAQDFNRTNIPPRSTLFAFYRDYSNVRLLIQDTVVSFGEPGDGYYKQHNYTAWSTSVGYGAPPVESFSTLVIAVMAAGLCVPALLALSGAVYVLARRCRDRNPPARLEEE